MAQKTTCLTPGSQFHTNIDERKVSVSIDLPFSLQLTEEEGETLDKILHNQLELVMQPYFKKASCNLSWYDKSLLDILNKEIKLATKDLNSYISKSSKRKNIKTAFFEIKNRIIKWIDQRVDGWIKKGYKEIGRAHV